ncbi:hypothetical protein [Pseudomonas batumici]|uniref:Uncharacterized protein n=1 Tax=Pseudomonas batumici TaxID=226910 RepID=A0A0C2HZR3_9PSED|nr:hypothetical protein [Pseudomonas batumici]KIH82576.1 hypothetical protein UCMB321_3711 [Pseudomonas batumici]
MSAARNPTRENKNIGRLLLELLWLLLVLLVPIFFVTILPPALALAVVFACAAGMWACVKLGWPKGGRAFARLMISAVFGLGFSLGRALPEYWSIAAAFLAIHPGLACVSLWERRLGLVTPTTENPTSGNGASAWGGQEPTLTPEGEPIRVFNQGEIAMGGPVMCDYLFPDGILLEGLGASARFSSDARYFAAPIPSRGNWGLVILDRPLRRLYRCRADQFWELDTFNEQGLGGRYSPLVDNGAHQHSLEDLLKDAEAIDLLPVSDLWLEPGNWQQALARQQIEYRSPDGRHLLEGQLTLPVSLRELDQPTTPINHPDYRLSLDGVPAPLLITAQTAIVWSADSRSLVCIARPLEPSEPHRPLWLWQQDRGWRALRSPWTSDDRGLGGYWSDPLALDEQQVWLESYLPLSQPDNGRFGYQLQGIHSDSQILVGHDPLGREQNAEWKQPRTRLVLPLDSDGSEASVTIESEPLLDGLRACFSQEQVDQDESVGYQCRIGDWTLPGLWRLDHRVSDCSRYLALVPFSPHPAIPDRVVVADPRQRRLIDSPPMRVAGLVDFRAATLSVAVIVGRLPRDVASTPLQRFTEAAPEASQAAEFCRYREDSRLYYELRRLQVAADRLQDLPTWRQVHQPQIATAEGEFIQPSPTGQDAAWLFGSTTEYGDDLGRGHIARLGGHLLTASGCALSDLAPSMAWSPKGRYLALTRLYLDHRDFADSYTRRAWKLLLLDIEARTLRTAPGWLGNRPHFIDFGADALHLRQFEADWDLRDGSDPGTRVKIALKEILEWPSEPLQPHADLWLTATEATHAQAWQTQERPEPLRLLL